MKKYKEICTSDLIKMIKTDKNGETIQEITDEEYNNIINSIPYFRNLGGREIVRVEKYSKYGYNIVRYINSISPNGIESIIYRFKV